MKETAWNKALEKKVPAGSQKTVWLFDELIRCIDLYIYISVYKHTGRGVHY